MAKYYKVAGTRLNIKLHKKFEDYCREHDCTIHTNLKRYVESLVDTPNKGEVSESKNVESRGKIEINNGSNNESISKSDGELQTANPTGTEEFFFI